MIHYRNGDAMPQITSNSAWISTTSGAYCVYNNDEASAAVYGRLYNWYAVNDGRKVAPTGWHVPTDAEWLTLVDYLGGDFVAGANLKEAGFAHWARPNYGATNESGFTGLPGGYRYGGDGSFNGMGGAGSFWSSTEYYSRIAWSRNFGCYNAGVTRDNRYKQDGFSVRCVRDN